MVKKTAAILGILLFLLLSACRSETTAGGGGMLPPTQSPSAGTPPLASTPVLEPEQSSSPAQDVVTPPQPSAAPAFLTAQELAQYAQVWSESYADRFAGYGAFRLDHAYWFSDYTGSAGQTAFTPADGLDGTVYFLPNSDGALSPAAAAAQMLNQAAEHLILVDRARMLEEISKRMSAMAEEGLTEHTALDLFLKGAKDTPALMENMWYCVNADDTGYILMAYEGAYRLQRMVAMTEYATAPVFQVRIAYDRAAEAYGWFHNGSMPVDLTAVAVREGVSYYRVDYPGIASMLELRSYLKTLFSDEIVDTLLSAGGYADLDGVLYGIGASGSPLANQVLGSVIQESQTRIIYTRGEDYVYERVGERWLFTHFPVPV